MIDVAAVLALVAVLAVLTTIARGTTTIATTTTTPRRNITNVAVQHAAHAPDPAWRWFIAAGGLALIVLAYQEWRESRVTAARAVAILAGASWIWAGAGWGFRAGVVILLTGLVLFVVAEILTRRNPRPSPRVTQPAQPSGHPPDSTPAGPRSTSGAAEERVEVDVTPEYLTGFFKDHMDVQAQKLAAPFIGKWMTVSGPLGNVGAWGGTHSQVTFNRPDIDVPTIYMILRDEAQLDRLSVLKHGDRITVCGQIDEINRVMVHLDPCELIDVVLTPVREQLLAAYAAGAAIRDQTIDADDRTEVSAWEKRHEDWKSQTYDWLRHDVDPTDAHFFTDTPEITATAKADLSGQALIAAYGSIHNVDRASLERELSNLTKLIERLG